MKLGVVSSILEGYSFEEVLKIVSRLGFDCLEVACWPQGRAERRYAGVSHIDVENETDAYRESIFHLCEKYKLQISSLAYYPNTMDGDLGNRKKNIEHLKKVIAASERLKVGMVTTFIGRDQTKTVEENLDLFREIWPSIISFAEERRVKVAIENCPMLFGAEQWPGGQNLATTPAIWRKMFEIIDSPYFGLNYDPSHCIWQMLDYIAPIYEFRDKLLHVHFKDIKLYPEKLAQVGTMAYPLQYMSPKLPGLGDIDWGKFVSALTDIGYDGYACIEVEDRAFEGTPEKIIHSIGQSKHYMEQYVYQEEKR